MPGGKFSVWRVSGKEEVRIGGLFTSWEAANKKATDLNQPPMKLHLD